MTDTLSDSLTGNDDDDDDPAEFQRVAKAKRAAALQSKLNALQQEMDSIKAQSVQRRKDKQEAVKRERRLIKQRMRVSAHVRVCVRAWVGGWSFG